MIFGDVKLSLTNYSVVVGTRMKRIRGTKKYEEVAIIERFTLPTPSGYDVTRLRSKLTAAVQRIKNGAKKVELSLYRWDQVNTVMGEMKAKFPGLKFSFGWTTQEEENTLFVIKRGSK